MIQNIKVCNIYAPLIEDYDLLKDRISKYPVNLSSSLPDSFDAEKVNLIIGWDHVKSLFENHNIIDKKISDNIFWFFSSTEDNKLFLKDIDEFIFSNLKKWLPSDFELFDPFFNVDFEEFSKKINKNVLSYTYFDCGALYVNNDKKNFIINLKSLSLVDKDIKKTITDFITQENFISFSFFNAAPFIKNDHILYLKTLENICWVKFGVEIEENVFFNVIPGFEIKKYIPFLMSHLPGFNLNTEEENSIKRLCEKDYIVRWISTRGICFSDSFEHNDLKFSYKDNKKIASLNYSHKRTLTGRIVCKDVYNSQNLQKDNDDKKVIESRFEGGNIFAFDYVSFESKIALYLSEDEKFINEYKDKDLHFETAKIIYDLYTPILNEERKLAKDINHAIMFGAGDEALLRKLAFLKNSEDVLLKIRQFLSPILNKAFHVNKLQKENGYIINDWGYMMVPNKDFAAFNNFIQSTAAEILVDKIFEIKKLLTGRKSQFLFPVYDSVVFDISPEENFLVPEILNILSCFKEMFFSVSYMSGPNYKNIGNEKTFSR